MQGPKTSTASRSLSGETGEAGGQLADDAGLPARERRQVERDEEVFIAFAAEAGGEVRVTIDSAAHTVTISAGPFEIAGAGGLQFIEHRPAVEQCFAPGKELLSFRTFEELLDLVSKARSHPEEMVSIRRAGAARALAEHTYRHRLDVILNAVT